ncbi:MAG: alpha-glucan family phosphorylase, partial [Deltaproteobacteria bacterium]|nr:alpha-glucan family phosphorylase [Deltaproteobacteria bacterium]
LEAVETETAIELEGKPVVVRAWRHQVRGLSGHVVPVYFLDTDHEKNSAPMRDCTRWLYGGDERYRLCQEAVLGLGGVALLRAMGSDIKIYHMNEGHSALLALALIREQLATPPGGGVLDTIRKQVRQRCVFTTHTPVPAGHDVFPCDMVHHLLGPDYATLMATLRLCLDGHLNMTYLALAFSGYINGVAFRHGEVSRTMFPEYPIDSITNGVHVPTWVHPAFARLFDERIPDWRNDNFDLRHAVNIPLERIRETHRAAKQDLFAEIAARTGRALQGDVFTIGYARRATTYKRPDLLFTDLERLRAIAKTHGALQIVYAGKAHPKDQPGKDLIRRIFAAAAALGNDIPVIYLEDYDMAVAKKLCAGVDLWLNTPRKPQEASGTSGMKAALNGVPSLSVLDGWWVEGHVEGVTGWSIGNHHHAEDDRAAEARGLYDKLAAILPLYYRQPDAYTYVRRCCIALNGSYFHAQRMLIQYLTIAYLRM